MLQDYSAFLYTIPWYKYPFRDTLNGLLAIPAPTPSQLRSWERDFALGTEYLAKIGYAHAIQGALDAGGDEEPRDIMFVVATLPPEVLAAEPRISRSVHSSPDWKLVQALRYKAFSEILSKLLDRQSPRGRDRRQPRHPHHGDRAGGHLSRYSRYAKLFFSLELDAKPATAAPG